MFNFYMLENKLYLKKSSVIDNDSQANFESFLILAKDFF